ncbi:uncharacterized protein LTR77_006097 [Saxophila tyrrhenica]|uniref:F-box domain-containing protein n=1 Tax=Saxophila tyrrhenica TaxID=1690608 RepID=A0AAV9P6X5_9PEZI|nr:hypothetical protein LTR77_006097 [Saxophila tyrrhenica]
MSSSTPPSSPDEKKQTEEPTRPPAKRRKFAASGPPSRHVMRTRSRVKIFPIMDLPPELRNNIYRHVFSDSIPEPIKLKAIRLPPLLSVSNIIRVEALSVFFYEETFTTTVRSNWCIRSRHYHSPLYHRYVECGNVELHPLLCSGQHILPKRAIRFRKLEFRVTCVCCDPGITIGVVDLEVVGRTPTWKLTMLNTKQAEAKLALEGMCVEVKELVEDVATRRRFNGFTVQDVVDVGDCFRDDGA